MYTLQAGKQHGIAVGVRGEVSHSLDTANGGKMSSEDGTGRGVPVVAYGGNRAGPLDVSPTLEAGHSQRNNPHHEAMIIDVQQDLSPHGKPKLQDHASPLKASGHKDQQVVVFDETQITSPLNYSNPKPGDPSHPLARGARPPTIAFSCKDHAADAGEVSPTLRAMAHSGSHPNAGGQVAVIHPEVAQPLRSNVHNNSDPGMEARMHVYCGMTVRRLTPRECERLQGFPDDWTLVTVRKKPAADGPRYKAIGNSMAVPCIRWIGKRIQAATR
jgi:DNA (cytosine-5)-methyltransferase 1